MLNKIKKDRNKEIHSRTKQRKILYKILRKLFLLIFKQLKKSFCLFQVHILEILMGEHFIFSMVIS